MKLFNEPTIKISEILKALGHPVRIEIVRMLSGRKDGKISVKQIHESLGLTQSETSRHLIILKNASVLSCDKDGVNSFYIINDKDLFIQCLVSCLNISPSKI